MNSFKGNYPYLLLILANMIWGGNFVIGRVAADYFPPLTFSLLRWLLAFLVLSLFMRNRLKSDWRILRNHKWILLLLSVTGIAGYNTIIYFSLHYTTSINAAVVNSTTPLFITFFLYSFLKKNSTLTKVLELLYRSLELRLSSQKVLYSHYNLFLLTKEICL